MKFNLTIVLSIMAAIIYGCRSESPEKSLPGIQPKAVADIFEKKGFLITTDNTTQPST